MLQNHRERAILTFNLTAEVCNVVALFCKLEPLICISLADCDAALACSLLEFTADSALVIVACAAASILRASLCVVAVVFTRLLIDCTSSLIDCNSTALASKVVWKLLSSDEDARDRCSAAKDNVAIADDMSTAA